MKRLEREAEHRSTHQEQARWLIIEVVLLAGEGHPSGARTAPDLPVKPRVEVLHPWLSHSAIEADVPLHRRGEARQVAIREQRANDGPAEARRAIALELCTEAPGTPRQEAERDTREDDDVRERSVPSRRPRRTDCKLRSEEGPGAYRSPPTRPGEERHRGCDE